MSASSASILARGGGGGGGAPPAQSGFDFFVVIDFEATCEKGRRIYPQEIIKFPAVLVDGTTGLLASEFRRYVRPQHHPLLTPFCRDLTGIGQADVDGRVDLPEALRLHDAWLAAAMAAARGGRKGGSFAVVTWGDWDCRTALAKECDFKGITKPPYFDSWIDLRVPFQSVFGVGGGWTTLPEALRVAGIDLEGCLHCGLDDARNTARLLVELMRRGVQFGIMSSLAVAPQPPQPQSSPCIGEAVCQCYCGVPARGGVMMMPGSTHRQLFYSCGSLMPACHGYLQAQYQR